ncbi:MAG: helix-turn-helix domain-containing protein [Clostridiales bacterium]|nr:helix-turn-helix domain-containing protein [Clostridiales bacterium]
MNQYVTGAFIKRLREKKKMTQKELAEIINVSEKAVSKWETGRGYPDITLIKPLASALGVSVTELFAGQDVVNTNISSDILKAKIYVCPICGNIIVSSGESVVSCCGISLPPLESEEADDEHKCSIEYIEDEIYLSLAHDMSKEHYISFIIALKDSGYEVKKLYPEGPADARFKRSEIRKILYYCNRHGLFEMKI